jgi:hypothetical protein
MKENHDLVRPLVVLSLLFAQFQIKPVPGYMTYRICGGGEQAETDLDNVFYSSARNGGKQVRSVKNKKKKNSTRGGSPQDPPDTDFESIFGKEVSYSGGRKTYKKRASRRKQSKRKQSKRRKAKRGGHSWSNVGVDRVRRSLQDGRIIETGRLVDYNVLGKLKY